MMNGIIPIGDPYPYQKELINFHREKKWSLCMAEQGLGKSLVALHSIKGCSKTLIVCPAFLRNNWRDEIKKWTKGGNFTITSYEGLKKIRSNDFDSILVDEIHYCKNKDAQRTKRVYALLSLGKPRYFIGLTGTPIKNRVTDFWAILKTVLQDKMPYNYWQYCNRFTHKEVINIRGRKITRFEGLKRAKELSDLVRTCAIRKKTKDVIDLPEKVYREIIIDDHDDDELKAKVDIYLNENSLSRNMASFKLVNAVEKAQSTFELGSQILEEGNSLVVFTDHIKSCERLAELFKVKPIHGQSNVDRDKIVKAFNAGTIKVIVATIPCLNVGVNLTSCNHMIINDFNYTPSEMAQAEKRIHRIGQKSTCFYYYMYASKLDWYIHDKLKHKSKIAKEIVDG